MLGIILIYFIGKQFYSLADNYNQNKWLFAILGVVTYYVGTAIGGLILAFSEIFFGLAIDWENNLLLSLIALPFGILAVYALYFILKKKWKNTFVEVKDEIQDIGKSSNDSGNFS